MDPQPSGNKNTRLQFPQDCLVGTGLLCGSSRRYWRQDRHTSSDYVAGHRRDPRLDSTGTGRASAHLGYFRDLPTALAPMSANVGGHGVSGVLHATILEGFMPDALREVWQRTGRRNYEINLFDN